MAAQESVAIMDPSKAKPASSEKPKSDTPKSSAESKISTIVSSLVNKEGNLDKAVRERQNKTPEISDQTKVFLGDLVARQYEALQKVVDKIAPDNPSLREYREFMKLFKESYYAETGKNISSASKDEITSAARGMMAQEKFQIWAIKLAEMHQSTLMAVTGATLVPLQIIEKEDYIPELYAHTPDAMEIADPDHMKKPAQKFKLKEYLKDKWEHPWETLVWKSLPEPSVPRTSPEAQRWFAASKKARQLEASRPWQTLVEVQIRRDNIIDLGASINGRHLDEVQKAFLSSIDGLGLNLTQGAEITNATREQVTKYLQGITAARINTYAHMGHTLTREDFNIIKKEPRIPPNRNYIDNPRTSLRTIQLDPIGLPGAEVSVGVGFGLRDQMQVLQDVLRQELKPALRKRKEEKILREMDSHVQRLSAEASQKKNEKRANEIDTKDNDEHALPLWKRRLEHLEKREELTKKRNEAEQERRRNEALLDTRTSIADPNNPTIMLTFREVRSRLQQAEADLETANSTLEQLKAYDKDSALFLQLEKRDQEEQTAIANNKTYKNKLKPDERATFDRLKPIFWGTATTDPLGKRLGDQEGRVVAATLALRHAKTIYHEGEVNQANSWIAKRNEQAVERAKMEDELSALQQKIGTELLTDPNNRNSPEYTVKDVKDRIKELETERNNANKTDEYKEQQVEVYKDVKELMSPAKYNEIRNRVKQPIDTVVDYDNLQNAMQIHPNYPPAYLHAIHILYGDEITEPGKIEDFKRATRVLTPDLFVQLLRRQMPVVDHNDPILRDIDLTRQIDKHFIRDLFNTLLIQGKVGELGKVRSEQQFILEAIKKTEAKKIDEQRRETNTTINKGVEQATRNAVTNEQIEDAIQNINNIQTMNVQWIAAEVRALRVQNIAPNIAVGELMNQFNQAGMTQGQAQEIVNRTYRLYDVRREMINQSGEIMNHALRQGRGTDTAALFAATALMIENMDEHELFLSQIEQGKRPEEIYLFLTAIDAANRPSFYEDFVKLYDRIIHLPPDHDVTALDNQIFQAFMDTKRRILNLGPNQRLPRTIQNEVSAMAKLMRVLEDKHRFELYIKEMDSKINIEGTVDELTAELLRINNLSVANIPQVKFQKMVAQEIIRRRVEYDRQSLSQRLEAVNQPVRRNALTGQAQPQAVPAGVRP